MKIFIFTEAYNCSIILIKALESYFKYHSDKVHIFGKREDFKELKRFKNFNIEFIDLSDDPNIEELYKDGHVGTAYIFARVISGHYGDYTHVIHFDSDVIFNGECLSDIITPFEQGFDLVGQRRPYRNNVANNGQYDNVPDVVGTCFFGVNIEKISKFEFELIHRMVIGYNPSGMATIDFFDPISFDVINNGGKIKYLDHMDYGSCDENGNYQNDHYFLNKEFDCGNKFLHWAGSGSGLKFHEKGHGNVPESYADWAIKRYFIYMNIFHGKEIDFVVDENITSELKRYLNV